jgi:hypothetical protein
MQLNTKTKNTSNRAYKPKKVNHWKAHHETLNDADKAKAKDSAMLACEWSQDTFYRKMRQPDKLKFWEKTLVAKAYCVAVDSLFPETEPVKA